MPEQCLPSCTNIQDHRSAPATPRWPANPLKDLRQCVDLVSTPLGPRPTRWILSTIGHWISSAEYGTECTSQRGAIGSSCSAHEQYSEWRVRFIGPQVCIGRTCGSPRPAKGRCSFQSVRTAGSTLARLQFGATPNLLPRSHRIWSVFIAVRAYCQSSSRFGSIGNPYKGSFGNWQRRAFLKSTSTQQAFAGPQ